MEEDTEYNKLPVEDRVVHKVIKFFFDIYFYFLTDILIFVIFFSSYGRLDCMVMKNARNHFVVLMMKNHRNLINLWVLLKNL